MADRSINELTQATELLDQGLTVVYQNNETKSIAGSALKAYAQNAIAADVSAVSTNTALCASYSSVASNAKDDAVSAKIAAQAAQSAIENMTVTAQNGATAGVVKTTTSGVVNLAFTLPAGAMGTITSIVKTGSSTVDGRIVDTYTVTCSDGSQFTFTITNGKDGLGTGDMEKSDYDPNSTVLTAGGIVAYISSQLASYVPTSRTVNNKPLTGDITLSSSDISGVVPTNRTINGLALTSDLTLSASYSVSVPQAGWAASSGYQQQTVTVTGLKSSYSVNPVVDVQLSGNSATDDQAAVEAFALITVISTGTNSLTLKCAGDAPSIDLTLIVNTWE